MDSVTRKRETPKKLYNDSKKPYMNRKRKTVKLSALSVGQIDCSRKKDQSYGSWVTEAVNFLYLEHKQKMEADRLRTMTYSSAYHDNVKLREDVDKLVKEVEIIKGLNDGHMIRNIQRKQEDKTMMKTIADMNQVMGKIVSTIQKKAAKKS